MEAVAEDIGRSEAWVTARRERVPSMSFPAELPVSAERARIAEAIDTHQVTVVCGATGSGKTTQLPKICLELGRGARGMIGHTQPRRIAARAVAGRIAGEIGEAGQGLVGWKVRFADRTGPGCQVKLMTDGILLAEIRDDPDLTGYDTLIIDEAHERSLNIDFLLGYLHRLLPRRPDLKVVITSATIDPARFAEHFGNAPVIEVGGATYPVEVRYRPPEDLETADIATGVLAAVDELAATEGAGDILVFLPGEREIRESAEALRKHHPAGTEVLPLYGRLSAAEQDRIFQPSDRRRIVLATNVAETSLTVPGIRHVIDTGLARISRYSYRSKIQRLQIEPVSRASADQRRGRCGREAPGVCVRLYAEDDYAERPAFTDPEVRRTNLASVILQMETLGLGHIEDFPFLDPPDPRFVRDGYRLLRELGAVDDRQQVGPMGRKLARLPVDPRLGRMILAGAELACLKEVLVIASALSVQDPRERPAESTAAADEAHGAFRDPRSDFLTLVRLWDAYQAERRHTSTSAQRRWARGRFLSFLRLREWHDIHQQLTGLVKDMGMKPNEVEADYACVHQALLAGLLSHIGHRDDKGEYEGARGIRFRVFPDSTLAARPPAWVTAAVLMETQRVWGRIAAAVEPAWIERAGTHLLKRSWSDPAWQPDRGFVAAREQVSLYGLILAANRRVDYGRVDRPAARRIFIREALVPGRLPSRGGFLARNLALVERVHALEARLRRRELFAGEQAVADFYDERLPAGICSTRAFERWRVRAEDADPQLLVMGLEDVTTGMGLPDPEAFPATMEVGQNQLPLSYRFDPADDDDGLTLTVPRHLLPLVDPERLEWLIPGWLGEKVTAMLRALPKAVRRRLVPIPEHARRCLELMRPGQGRLHAALAEAVRRTAGVEVEPEVWDGLELEPWLRVRVVVTDEEGKPLEASRDPAGVRRRLEPGGGPVAGPSAGPWQGEGLRTWSFGPVPDALEVDRGGVRQRLFPGIHDDGGSVSLALYPTPSSAAIATRRGVLRLFTLGMPQQYRGLLKAARGDKALILRGRGLSGGEDLGEDLAEGAFQAAFLPPGEEVPRTPEAFRQRLERGRGEVVPAGERLLKIVREILGLRADVVRRLDRGLTGPGAAQAEEDVKRQVESLFPAGFLATVPGARLQEYPRYLQAVLVRVDRLATGKGEARQVLDLKPHRERVAEGIDAPAASPEALEAFETYRWMVEEFRVSLFAQTLGTRGKVSAARLESQWDRVRALKAGLAPAN
jgi:ATP-dependent helicase HrpA